MVLHPLKGKQKVWKPQQKEIYGKYVSTVFSFPVWLKQTNKQTTPPKPLIFCWNKQRQDFLEKEFLCKAMSPIKWFIMTSSLPSFSFP